MAKKLRKTPVKLRRKAKKLLAKTRRWGPFMHARSGRISCLTLCGRAIFLRVGSKWLALSFHRIPDREKK